jgi:hypothetical protein
VLHVKKFHSALLALALVPIAVGARAEPVTMTVTIDALTDRTFRGVIVNEEPVLQPGFTLGWKGWSATAWATMDMTHPDDKKNVSDRHMDVPEANYTVAYDHDFGTLALGGGFTYRAFPGQDETRDTAEGFVRFRADLPVVVSLQIVRDFDEAHGWYTNLGLGHSFMVGARTHLDLDGTCGWGNEDMNQHLFGLREESLSDAHLVLGVRHDVSPMITWRGWADYSKIVDGDLNDMPADDDNLTIGTGGTFRF